MEGNTTEQDEVIHLNIGGIYFATRRSTLLESDSFFSGAVHSHSDCHELFVDRDPTHFRHILNWMRGVKYLPEDDTILQELSWEADYFCMDQLREAIMRSKHRHSVPRTLSAIHTELKQLGRNPVTE